MYSSDELFQCSRDGYFDCHESTYIILFLARHNEFINDDKNDNLYTSSPCLARSVFVLLVTSQSIADDVTMTRQLWRDHVNNDI